MRRVVATIIVATFAATLPGISEAANSIAGTNCAISGAVQIYKGKKFTCIKSGKKLVWNKGTLIPTPAITPTPIPITPSPTPSPTPSAQPSPTSTPTPTPSKISDKLSFKNPMIYGLSNGVLTRRSDAGAFFNDDSRKELDFSKIRTDAFNALNVSPTTLEHPNIQINYVVRDSFPKELVTYAKKQFEEAAAFWNPYLPKNIPITIYLVTEKDREFIKDYRWLNINLPKTFDRFDTHAERPFISGGGRYWQDNGIWEGKIYLATASYVDLNYINYEWPQVAKHEFTHVIQDFFYSKDGRFGATNEDAFFQVLPTNFMEGSANTFGFLNGFQNLGWSSDAMDWLVWSRARNNEYWMTVNSKADAIKMMEATERNDPDGAFEMSYAIGALMFEWVIANYGFKGYLSILNQLSTSPSFDETLKHSIGLSKSEFYDAVAPYVLEIFKKVQTP